MLVPVSVLKAMTAWWRTACCIRFRLVYNRSLRSLSPSQPLLHFPLPGYLKKGIDIKDCVILSRQKKSFAKVVGEGRRDEVDKTKMAEEIGGNVYNVTSRADTGQVQSTNNRSIIPYTPKVGLAAVT